MQNSYPAIHSAPGSKFNMFHLTKLSTYLLQILELEETKPEKPERKIIDISSSEEEEEEENYDTAEEGEPEEINEKKIDSFLKEERKNAITLCIKGRHAWVLKKMEHLCVETANPSNQKETGYAQKKSLFVKFVRRDLTESIT